MNQPENCRVYVVDDDPRVLTATSRLLKTEGYDVAGYESPREFLRARDTAVVGCVLLDVGMTELSGPEIQTLLLARGDTIPIIFITGYDDAQTGVSAIKAGAFDYLTKPAPDTLLLQAVAAAVRSDLARRRERINLAEQARRWRSLTAREGEVMMHVVRGQLNKQIAFDLKIGEKTVKVHRGRVMEKMAIRSVAGLIHIADQLERAGYVSKLVDNHVR